MGKRLLITNLVYGEVYTGLFLENHLKSLLDPTNVPAYQDRLEYIIFTDMASARVIEAHPNWQALCKLVPTDMVQMTPATFDDRYTVLVTLFKESVKTAMASGTYLSAIVADLVMAKGYFQKIFKHLDAGYDSVFMLPLRAAATGVRNTLQRAMYAAEGALEPRELCLLGYDNLHPLWVACHWRAPQFTDQPYTLLWNSGTGLLARSFSITPIAFTPYKEMLDIVGGIDGDAPSMCKNPYWATDWEEAPVIGVEPIECFYPPFTNLQANADLIAKHFSQRLHPTQVPFLGKKLYYPCKEIVGDDPAFELQEIESDLVVNNITTGVSK